jgi:hypothetical protein
LRFCRAVGSKRGSKEYSRGTFFNGRMEQAWVLVVDEDEEHSCVALGEVGFASFCEGKSVVLNEGKVDTSWETRESVEKG